MNSSKKKQLRILLLVSGIEYARNASTASSVKILPLETPLGSFPLGSFPQFRPGSGKDTAQGVFIWFNIWQKVFWLVVCFLSLCFSCFGLFASGNELGFRMLFFLMENSVRRWKWLYLYYIFVFWQMQVNETIATELWIFIWFIC